MQQTNPIWLEDRKRGLKMVAISLYRGNLHRTPDVPRRWLMPNPKITLKDFKSLLARRSKALSRLNATTPNPNPNPDPANVSARFNLDPAPPVTNHGEGPSRKPEEEEEESLKEMDSKKPVEGSDLFIDSKNDDLEKISEHVDDGAALIEKHTDPITDNVDMLDDKEKRKKEVEDKLQILNAKKHNLVLVLKQILNAEEELKRRNSMQAIAMHGPSVPLQTNGTHDSGSMTRHLVPRLGSEGNLVGDLEGSEADDLVNHNMQSRQMLRTSSMSPSSESPLRRTTSTQPNMASYTPRASLGATSSPSRFALSGHQGNPMNLASVSVSGTSYIASSPSPAASGGTSVFRDAQQPSPWK
ncbi:PREDICTED: uncharacterized protein LOC109336985 isoform X2 [Lupinus angustifolius]|uniref:uncharacterized protein LOC109336985 isoform X2 n=1 Tax=Lupinus angustifolius TaxID=3871 RepID=UPI00092F270B|nr:PREDICTED: uncharacterized protein LOC109336985 isoform X2 [Lupinus angustifolius]